MDTYSLSSSYKLLFTNMDKLDDINEKIHDINQFEFEK